MLASGPLSDASARAGHLVAPVTTCPELGPPRAGIGSQTSRCTYGRIPSAQRLSSDRRLSLERAVLVRSGAACGRAGLRRNDRPAVHGRARPGREQHHRAVGVFPRWPDLASRLQRDLHTGRLSPQQAVAIIDAAVDFIDRYAIADGDRRDPNWRQAATGRRRSFDAVGDGAPDELTEVPGRTGSS